MASALRVMLAVSLATFGSESNCAKLRTISASCCWRYSRTALRVAFGERSCAMANAVTRHNAPTMIAHRFCFSMAVMIKQPSKEQRDAAYFFLLFFFAGAGFFFATAFFGAGFFPAGFAAAFAGAAFFAGGESRTVFCLPAGAACFTGAAAGGVLAASVAGAAGAGTGAPANAFLGLRPRFLGA